MVCRFVEVGQLDVAVEEESFAEYFGVEDCDVLKFGLDVAKLFVDREGHLEFVGADGKSERRHTYRILGARKKGFKESRVNGDGPRII